MTNQRKNLTRSQGQSCPKNQNKFINFSNWLTFDDFQDEFDFLCLVEAQMWRQRKTQSSISPNFRDISTWKNFDFRLKKASFSTKNSLPTSVTRTDNF